MSNNISSNTDHKTPSPAGEGGGGVRWAEVFPLLAEAIPNPQTELHYETPFQLLVAVILSAQCTDKRINLVTPALFHDYPTPEAMACATEDVIFEYVKSVSYPRNKARHLVQMAKMLLSDYQGEVPDTMEQLLKLPGVGRKTANVILGVVFSQSAMAVDTHVFRVSHRIGLVPPSATTPLAVEQCLMRHIPKHQVPDAHHLLILHGRYTCQARKPQCHACPLLGVCRRVGVE